MTERDKFEVHFCVIGAFVYNRTFDAFGVPYLPGVLPIDSNLRSRRSMAHN